MACQGPAKGDNVTQLIVLYKHVNLVSSHHLPSSVSVLKMKLPRELHVPAPSAQQRALRRTACWMTAIRGQGIPVISRAAETSQRQVQGSASGDLQQAQVCASGRGQQTRTFQGLKHHQLSSRTSATRSRRTWVGRLQLLFQL